MSEVFLLTGAASGIGRHLVGELAAVGHRILATDVRPEALEQACQAEAWPADRVRTARLDVRSAAEWEAALSACLQAFAGVDVLLNVAGYLKPGNCWELERADVDLHFDVNVKGVVHGTAVVGRYFQKQRRGHIVNIGSLASLAAAPGLALYSASKFAVRGFSLASAQELKPHGVAVSLVMPDAVRTPMLDLQVDYPQAALTFSGARALSVADVTRVVLEEVLPNRPLEVTLPLGRGVLARFADALPALAMKLGPLLTKRGLLAQQRLKRER